MKFIAKYGSKNLVNGDTALVTWTHLKVSLVGVSHDSLSLSALPTVCSIVP